VQDYPSISEAGVTQALTSLPRPSGSWPHAIL
jgi:hypothetical protein